MPQILGMGSGIGEMGVRTIQRNQYSDKKITDKDALHVDLFLSAGDIPLIINASYVEGLI